MSHDEETLVETSANAVDAEQAEVTEVAEMADAAVEVESVEAEAAVVEVEPNGEVDETSDAEASDNDGEAATTGSRRSRREEALTNEGEIAADYLEELLDITDMDGDIDTFNEGGRAHVSILTDSEVLVGRDGEVLEALQELARLAVMTESGHRSRLMLDIAGHREKRRTVLQDLARDAVTEVTATGEAVRLSPMNPFERKVVHDAVANAGLVSESEGEEPNRRVVVMPRG